MNSRIDVRPEHLRAVRQLLQKYVPDREVRVFGSRVQGTAKIASDLDLCIMGNKPVATIIIDRLDMAFSESELPFKVDVVEWVRLSERFREMIRPNFATIQTRKRRQSRHMQPRQ